MGYPRCPGGSCTLKYITYVFPKPEGAEGSDEGVEYAEAVGECLKPEGAGGCKCTIIGTEETLKDNKVIDTREVLHGASVLAKSLPKGNDKGGNGTRITYTAGCVKYGSTLSKQLKKG